MEPNLLLIGLIQALFVLLTAPLYSGFSRVIRAKMHSRKGPPLTQNYLDILKLMKRQEVIPAPATWIFRVTPYIVMATALLIVMLLPLWTWQSPLGIVGDVILVVYLFGTIRFFVAMAGLDSGSGFAGIGVSREMALGMLVEPTIILVLFVVALHAGSTNLGAISTAIGSGRVPFITPAIWLGLAAFALVSYIELGKLPYDMAEAEQEVQEGALTEYSGRGLALMKWGQAIKQMAVVGLFLSVFFPFGNAASLELVPLLIGLVLFGVKMGLCYLVIGIIENSMARATLFSVPRITWASLGIALLSLIFYVVQA
ncbi:Formate hydrogenlyase subunit 4 [Thermoflexales bacterium]|jgi:hydrogenase-4 component C|nr:Formate hydrogenlyase subunit 4 [Thermoflexales bacterium]